MTGELVENAVDLVDKRWKLEVLGDFNRIHCTGCTVCNQEGCHKLDEAAGVGFQRVVVFRKKEAVSLALKEGNAGQVSQ